ncbi:putative TSC22 domain family member 3 protein, partial [Naja naja]
MSSSPLKERRSPVGLDCCSCCLDLANGPLGYNSNLSPLLQLREQLACESLGAASELRRLMRQDSLEPVVRDPRYLLSRGICNRNIDQTLLSILLFFHSRSFFRSRRCVPSALGPAMSTGVYPFPMEVAVYQLHNFSISFFSSLLGGDVVSVKLDN